MGQIEPTGGTLYVYKASAGAGKTFTLAVEYILVLLTHPGEQEYAKTLAVTFTNKATAEMKDRILQQLFGIGHGLKESEGYLERISKRLQEMGRPMDDEAIRERCREALSRILHDYGRFRVETIDSFFQSILRDLARELGLNPNLQVDLDNKKVIATAVDRIIDNLQESPQLQQWILRYVDEQLDENGRWDIAMKLKDFAKCIFEESLQSRTDDERKRLNDEKYIQDFRNSMYKIEQSSRETIEMKADMLLKRIEDGTLTEERMSHGKDITSIIKKMRNLEFDLRVPNKTYEKVQENPSSLLKKPDKEDVFLAHGAREIAAGLHEMYDVYKEYFCLYCSANLARKHTNPMRLLSEIERTVNEVNEEKNQFSLSKTPTLLANLVKNSDAPFVFEKAGTMFRNVLIDEFQDTSSLQWRNFKVLLLENQASAGSSLLVGDVKQSIYRWRNGDWGILAGIEKELKNMSPKSIPLNTNFRSRGKVIDFNNDLFPKIARIMDDAGQNEKFRIQDIYNDVIQEKKKEPDKGFVYVRLCKKEGRSKPADYNENIVDDMILHIRQLREKGQNLNQMAILLRQKNDTEQLISIFHEKATDIPLVSDEAFLLQASKSVQIIIDALRILIDPDGHDQVSRYSLARNYHERVLHDSLPIDTLFFSPAESLLPEDFLQQREKLVQMPLYLLCEKLFRLFSLHEIKGQEPYLYTFYDELQKYIRDNPSDIQSFLSYWDESMYQTPIPSGNVGGIRILTIHKSKGLEFETVFIPFTDWSIQTDRNEIWCKAPKKPFDGLGLLPIKPGIPMQASVFAKDMKDEYLQQRVDAINILYVAFTRAKCNLLIWGYTNNSYTATTSSIAGDLLLAALEEKNMEQEGQYLIWKSGEPYVPAPEKEEKEEDEKLNRLAPIEKKMNVNIVSVPPRIDFQQSNLSQQFLQNLEDESDTQSYLELGKILHFVLSDIRHLDDVPRILKRCQNQGLINDEKARDNILQRIQFGMQNPTIRSWFSEDKQIFNECSIAHIDEETGQPAVKRPDRVVMNDNKVIVIDFKFGRPCSNYYDQVARYMKLMHEMYPKKKIEGWLWYVYSGRICPISIDEKNGK